MLHGKRALVTGSTRGIGLGIARALAAEGAKVAVSSRSREGIDGAASEIGALPLVHDSAELDAVPALLKEVERGLGPVDIAVTNTVTPMANSTRVEPLSFSLQLLMRSIVLASLD